MLLNVITLTITIILCILSIIYGVIWIIAINEVKQTKDSFFSDLTVNIDEYIEEEDIINGYDIRLYKYAKQGSDKMNIEQELKSRIVNKLCTNESILDYFLKNYAYSLIDEKKPKYIYDLAVDFKKMINSNPSGIKFDIGYDIYPPDDNDGLIFDRVEVKVYINNTYEVHQFRKLLYYIDFKFISDLDGEYWAFDFTINTDVLLAGKYDQFLDKLIDNFYTDMF